MDASRPPYLLYLNVNYSMPKLNNLTSAYFCNIIACYVVYMIHCYILTSYRSLFCNIVTNSES